MKKSTGIRLFLVLAVVLCGSAYAIGYYYSMQQWEKAKAREQALAGEQRENKNVDVSKETSGGKGSSTGEYVLGEQDGYVIVYYADRETVYSTTDIPIKYLSSPLQREIREGKPLYSEAELFNFLESYTS